MICRIHGQLESLDGSKAILQLDGGLTYEVLVPAFVAVRLAVSTGQPVTLHTVHFLEGTSQGSHFTPRLIGFLDVEQRRFYELFITVKGIGPRKALRAMSLDVAQIAGAIADRDLKLLQSLPEIGRRMAETVVATLHGKVDDFITAATYRPRKDESTTGPSTGGAAREALAILLQLGEPRVQAVQWIDQVMLKNPDLADAQAIITECFRLKNR
ncbi:MAG: Holliday junction branch migration protein RuvA [Phycisphaerales bacterium]